MSTGQLDFGGFDTTFLGITLQFRSDIWERFDQFHGLDRNPADVISLGNQALQSGKEEAFEVFSSATVVCHELRHFHDHLLSPIGNNIWRLRFRAAINGSQALGSLTSKNKILPVPIQKWQALSENEKSLKLTRWSKYLGIEVDEIDLDMRSEEALVFAETIKSYKRIREYVTAPRISDRTPYHPFHLFEGSAIAVQLQNVWSVFGVEHADLFLNQLETSTSNYTLALKGWMFMCKSRGIYFDIRFFSMALNWSLLGDYEKHGWEACPTERFARLVMLLAKVGLPKNDKPIFEVYDQWSTLLQYSGVESALKRSDDRNQILLDGLAKAPHFQSELVSLYSQFVSARRHLVSSFLERPETYVFPLEYNENVDRFPAAPIRLDFPFERLYGPRSLLEKKMHILAATGNDKMWYVRRALFPSQSPGKAVLDPILCASVSDFLSMVDFFFAEFRRNDLEFDIVRQSLGKDKFAMEVF